MAKRQRKRKRRKARAKRPQRVGRVGVRWDDRAGRQAWYLRWTDKAGKQHSRLADSHLATALQAARELDRQLTNERLGLQTADPHRVSIEKLMADYLKWLLHRPSSEKHIAETDSILKRMFAAIVPGSAKYVAQVRRRDVERYLDGLAEGNPADEKDDGLSGRTVNKHLTAAKALFAWAVKQERLPSSPLAGLDLRPQYEKRVRRQALKPDGVEKLLRASRRPAAEPWEHMAYSLAVGAGLRKGEVETLRRWHVELHTRRLEGSYSFQAAEQKGHKDTRVPFRPELVRLLRSWFRAQGPDATLDSLVVPGFPDNPVPALKLTLEAAGIPYRNAAGEVCDFHALRHTFVTNMKVALPVKQMLARHADVKTTMGYEHTDFEAMRAAVEKLPTVSGKAKRRTAKTPRKG